MKLTKRYAFLVIGNVGNFQMAQETALRFLRILRGLLFPHFVPRFPTTSDYSVAYSTTLLYCKYRPLWYWMGHNENHMAEKILEEFFDSYNAIYDIYESEFKNMQSIDKSGLEKIFNEDLSYFQSLIESVNQHEKISFLHNTPIIPGVGLLGSIKQNRENTKFLNCLEIKVFDNKGIHQLTQIVAEKIYELCSVLSEMKNKEAISEDEIRNKIGIIKTVFKNCEDAFNNMSNDVFAYNYETSQGNVQLWGILTLACEKQISKLDAGKKKGFFKSLFG